MGKCGANLVRYPKLQEILLYFRLRVAMDAKRTILWKIETWVERQPKKLLSIQTGTGGLCTMVQWTREAVIIEAITNRAVYHM